MHVSFKIHYRNNLIDKKHSYLIPRPPSWDDRNCSYGHQLYPSENWDVLVTRVHSFHYLIINTCIFHFYFVKTLIRDRPFNLKGGLWFFVSFRIFFSDNTRVRIFNFFVGQSANFFSRI